MSAARSADVIVAVDRDIPAALACLQSVLKFSGTLLHRLILIADAPPGAEIGHTLEQLAKVDSRLTILHQADSPGYVHACNRGLSDREGDAVILGANSRVTEGWLSELSTVAHSEERTACAWPLSNRGKAGSHPATNPGMLDELIDKAEVKAAYLGLPRSTTTPSAGGSCVYFRDEMIDAVGLLDATFTSSDSAFDDWAMRAQALGFFVKRANHAFVHHSGSLAAEQEATFLVDRGRAILDQRHPQLRTQVETFNKTLDGRLAAHAADFQWTGKLRVAYDIRHLPPENVGTRTYAVNLARALAGLSEIELTLLVSTPVQAAGLEGRVVTEKQWRDDVALIHKPAQIFNRHELALLFGSSAHVVITYQDLIAYRIPDVFRTDREFDAYRATSSLSLQAAQGILAYSESSGREIASEFGIPRREVVVVPLGVEGEWFAHREPGDAAIVRKLNLPRRYFFSLATDYPHKNVSSLLDAYALMRGSWLGSDPPGLVLAGYSLGARARLYDGMKSEPLSNGLTFLGPVSADELRVLYQGALALVFPSLYEGFGLPPLEAMAAGTPVVAMPFSSVREVGGDAVLYAEGLSAADLARAMECVAASEPLRAGLRNRGLQRAAQFRWEKTARAAFELYRSAVLEPTERSLHARRSLRLAILHWSEPAKLTIRGRCWSLSSRFVETAVKSGIRAAVRKSLGKITRKINARIPTRSTSTPAVFAGSSPVDDPVDRFQDRRSPHATHALLRKSS